MTRLDQFLSRFDTDPNLRARITIAETRRVSSLGTLQRSATSTTLRALENFPSLAQVREKRPIALSGVRDLAVVDPPQRGMLSPLEHDHDTPFRRVNCPQM